MKRYIIECSRKDASTRHYHGQSLHCITANSEEGARTKFAKESPDYNLNAIFVEITSNNKKVKYN